MTIYLVRIVILAAILATVASIFGCAAELRDEVCYEKFMGRTDDGLNVVRHLCMTPEAFVEAQK